MQVGIDTPVTGYDIIYIIIYIMYHYVTSNRDVTKNKGYGYIWVYMGIYGYICMGIGTWGNKHYKLVLD